MEEWLSILKRIEVLSLKSRTAYSFCVFGVLIIIVCFVLFTDVFCRMSNVECRMQKQYKETRLVLGTIAKITIIIDSKAENPLNPPCQGDLFLDKCFAELKRIEDALSVYKKDSEIYKLNHRKEDIVTVSPELFYLIRKSHEISEKTNGAFDITVMPLISLWKQKEKQNKLPEDQEIAKVLDRVGYKKIKFLKNNTIKLAPGMQIDLGGIAKGYAIDKIAKILYNNQINDFLINIGGDIFASGKKQGGDPWKIGLQDPAKEQGILDKFILESRAVVTSGDYARFFKINNKKFSHIIDPKTGWPVKKSKSITIFSDNIIDADAIATAVSVMTKKEALAFLKSYPEIDYILMFENGKEAKHGMVLTS